MAFPNFTILGILKSFSKTVHFLQDNLGFFFSRRESSAVGERKGLSKLCQPRIISLLPIKPALKPYASVLILNKENIFRGFPILTLDGILSFRQRVLGAVAARVTGQKKLQRPRGRGVPASTIGCSALEPAPRQDRLFSPSCFH